jgi:hypothetical protein
MQPSSQALTFSHQGKTLTLHRSQLDNWFIQTLTRHKQPTSNATTNVNQILSQFGIKSSHDMLLFLQSPTGLAKQSTLKKAFAEIIALEKNALFQNQQLLARHRAIAFFILGMMHNKVKAKEYQQHIVMQEQLNKKLHKQSTPAQTSTSTLPREVLIELEETLNHYESARVSLQAELTTSETLAELLEREWFEFEKMVLLFKEECVIYDTFMHEVHTLLVDHDLDSDGITQKRSDIEQHYQKEANAINQLIASINPDDEPTLLVRLQENAARRLQLFMLDDLLNHLPENKKIIHQHGKDYLLATHQTLDTLSVEDKEQAHQAYVALKPRFEATRITVEKTRHLEREQQTAQHASLSTRSNELQQTLKQASQQLGHIQTFILQTQASIAQTKQHQTQQTIPTLKLTPSTMPQRSSKEQEQSTYATCLYRLELCKIRNNPAQPPHLSAQSINNLTNINSTQLQNAAAQQQLRPGMPISPILMQALLRYNNGTVAQQANATSPVQSPYKSPSPFNITPRPDDK